MRLARVKVTPGEGTARKLRRRRACTVAAVKRARAPEQPKDASGVSIASVDCAAAGAVRCWAPTTSLTCCSRSSRSSSSSASSGLRPTRIRQRRNPPRARCASSERRSTEMCGVIGYTGGGRRDASSILVRGLARLEYRGYDSAGVAVHTGDGIVTRKLAGRVPDLQALLARSPVSGASGIAHTRWATHGAPTTRNAHPHVDCNEGIAVVHNGIIENADTLRRALEGCGHTFRTETDTETLAQLRAVDDVTWDLEAIALGPYAHFMQKEIFEQADTVRGTLRGRLVFDEGVARLNGLNITPDDCAAINRITIVACGTSWHAGLVGRQIIESLAQIPVTVEYASEYRYRRPLPASNTLTIAISQSGETADTLEAMRAARAAGSRVLGIVNVVGSTIARESDGGIYLHAGPEIGVASTKAFTSQIAALAMLGLHLGRQRGLTEEEGRDFVCRLAQLPSLVQRALELEPEVKRLAERYAREHNFLYLGRGVNFAVALEGALKLKEISYIHAEGYPAAEMKHGPIALIDENMPAVFVAPKDDVYTKVLSNMQEVRARGGRIIAITSER